MKMEQNSYSELVRSKEMPTFIERNVLHFGLAADATSLTERSLDTNNSDKTLEMRSQISRWLWAAKSQTLVLYWRQISDNSQ